MIKNYQILKEAINSTIQKSNLDIGAIYFIFKDIFKEIEMLYYTQINKELMEENLTEIVKATENEEVSGNINN